MKGWTPFRYLELALLLAGLFLLGRAGWNLLRYSAFESHPKWFAVNPVSQPILKKSARKPAGVANAIRILGRLEVPRLGMSVFIVDGDDSRSLSLAAGHVPGTAPVGGVGNTVIAGHRDTAFWPLRRIKSGDRVRIIRGAQIYLYTVKHISIVQPDDVGVLRNSGKRMLTLVTCYPFRYVGAAPERYIIQA
ncbi:MAG: class D sortase, partial [Bryobacteraceae bacterium]